jgi:hypothetical protein
MENYESIIAIQEKLIFATQLPGGQPLLLLLLNMPNGRYIVIACGGTDTRVQKAIPMSPMPYRKYNEEEPIQFIF